MSGGGGACKVVGCHRQGARLLELQGDECGGRVDVLEDVDGLSVGVCVHGLDDLRGLLGRQLAGRGSHGEGGGGNGGDRCWGGGGAFRFGAVRGDGIANAIQLRKSKNRR